eukprot:g387.t1
MTKGQFFELGCPNCRDLQMQENENRVYACTSSSYSGFFSMVNPGAFASRFNGLEKRMPGCYALVVHGRLPDFDVDDDYEPEGETEAESGQQSRDPDQPRSGAASPASSQSQHHTDSEDFDMNQLMASPLLSPSPGLEKPKVDRKKGSSGKPRRTEASSSPLSQDPPKTAEVPQKKKRLKRMEAAEAAEESPVSASSEKKTQAAPILKEDDSAEFR